MTMGDRICVMKDGVIQQIAAPLELYNRPANRFVAGFIGSPPMNFLEVELAEEAGHIWLREKGAPNGSRALHLKLVRRWKRPRKFSLDRASSWASARKRFTTSFFTRAERRKAPAQSDRGSGGADGRGKIFVPQHRQEQHGRRVEPHNSAKPHQDIEIVFNMESIHLFTQKTKRRSHRRPPFQF